MTIKNLYPKARPQNIYNVINGRPELPAASTFSRASEATYVDANGIIRTAAVDEPRFNYDPETGEFLGLLLEDGTTNSYPTSDFSSEDGYALNCSFVTEDFGPLGVIKGFELDSSVSNANFLRDVTAAGGTSYVMSCYIYSPSGEAPIIQEPGRPANNPGWDCGFSFMNRTTDLKRVDTVQVSGFVWRVLAYGIVDSNAIADNCGILRYPANTDKRLVFSAFQVELNKTIGSSYIETTSNAPVTREPETFSLTSSSNFDRGFSLLLDSETTTDDYFYKIKASGTTIAELNNANGTLDWVINGESAATTVPPQYPQVGAIQPGRVRTISSFGAADGTTQQNYLYTEGLSFPTNAIVASGADEVEFGPGQTLKAVYLWNGQLSNTEAVSVIKGEYNIVPNEPIKADSYSFVYNTDPTNVGETAITLRYIVPTVSMRVYWGDGTDSAYEQGVTPSHTYPYAGQYRIQIEADAGFDAVRLADVTATITNVDQWAPQHRVGASGPGFTGEDMNSLLTKQQTNKLIPPFKYTNLTDIGYCFDQNREAACNNWDFVPYVLPECTKVSGAFWNLAIDNSTASERSSFPQLQTTDKLTSAVGTFYQSYVNGWVEKDNGDRPTNKPFKDSSKVTDFTYCFWTNGLTDIDVDTSAALKLDRAFGQNGWVTFPFITTDVCKSFQSTWSGCSSMTGFPNINTGSGTNFTAAWNDCSNLTSFPSIDTGSGTNFASAWRDCTSLTSFPLINTSNATSLNGAWYGCQVLDNISTLGDATSFPKIDTKNVTVFNDTWRGCSSITKFPEIDTSNGINFQGAWRNCSLTEFPSLDLSKGTNFVYAWLNYKGTTFPNLDTSEGTSFSNAWQNSAEIVSFPSTFKFTKGTIFSTAWNNMNKLTDFPPNMFDTTGTLDGNAFSASWSYCALTAQSIENILVSLDTNGQSGIVLSIDDGTNAGQSTWTAAANTAYTNLINKGWTITFNP